MTRWTYSHVLLWSLCPTVGCYSGPPPLELTSVEPDTVKADEAATIALVGRNFFTTTVRLNLDSPNASQLDATFRASLIAPDGSRIALDDVQRDSNTRVEARVPMGVPAAVYAIELDGPGNAIDRLEAALTVVPSTAVVSCSVASDCAADPCLQNPTCVDGACVGDRVVLAVADTCDGVDNDCDGAIDEDPDLVWYADADGDGFGDAGRSLLACAAPVDHVDDATDCDDDPLDCGAACNLGAEESPAATNCSDDYDNDCDGLIDLEDLDCLGGPTPIFRSVGPGNTAPLASGAGNALTISNMTAEFSSALPLNVGVGDVVVYDSTDDGSRDAIAFITKRGSDHTYEVASTDGGQPLPCSPDEDWAIFRAYTSLDEADRGAENPGIDAALRNFDDWSGGYNIVSAGLAWNIACYADAADTTPVVIDGWTTDPEHVLRIFAPAAPSEVGVSQRHPGAWSSSAYTLSVDGTALEVFEAAVRIEGLQLVSSGAPISVLRVAAPPDSRIWVVQNLVTAPSAIALGMVGITGSLGPRSVGRIYNNVIFDIGDFTADAIRFEAGTFFIANNTVSDIGDDGIVGGFGPDVRAQNNVCQQVGGVCFFGPFEPASDYNLSDDDTSTGGANDLTSTSLSFQEPSAGDFHLSPSDAAAIDAGIDLSSDADVPFSTDIDGETRGVWDLGADEHG